MNMNDLLESLYTKENSNNSLEKTAEAKLMSALNNSNQTENPFMDLDLDTLVKLASDMEEVEAEEELPEEFQETEMDMLGGQIMAHACVHELGLMKEAMANGLCRVCKANHFDIEGSTVCSQCLEG